MTELRPWTWPWLLATTLSRAAVAALVCLALWGALPAVIGWHPTTVSSGSMLPRLHVGDVAVSRPVGATPPTVGSVLLFDDPDHPGRLRMHRFVRVDDDGQLITRGDANTADDSTPVALAAVRGIGTLRVPWVGLPVVWLREGAWLPLGLTVAVLLVLTAVAAKSRSFGFGEETGTAPDEEPPPPPSGGDGAPAEPDVRVAQPRREQAHVGGGAPSSARTVGRSTGRLAALGVAALLAVVPAAPAGAAFTGRTSGTVGLGAATSFTCANAVAAIRPTFWYRMDETSSTTTTATDSSGGARTGVYGQSGKTAGATRACVRDSGRAMTFNGSSGYLSSPVLTSAVPNTFTLSIWFRTTTTRGGKLIGFGNAQTGLSPNYDRHLYLTDAGSVVFGVYPGTVRTVASATTTNDGGWHQAVGTLSGAGMRLYVDGRLAGSDPSVTSGEGYTSPYLRIGYDNLNGWTSAPSSAFFAGTLDDAVFSTTALTAAEVEAQYEAGTS